MCVCVSICIDCLCDDSLQRCCKTQSKRCSHFAFLAKEFQWTCAWSSHLECLPRIKRQGIEMMKSEFNQFWCPRKCGTHEANRCVTHGHFSRGFCYWQCGANWKVQILKIFVHFQWFFILKLNFMMLLLLYLKIKLLIPIFVKKI